MAFVQKIGSAINPYTAYLPTGMQQSAQQQAGRQFLGGLAQNFLAAAGPSRYPTPTVAGLAGINPAIQSAQQTQNVALQNAINAQKLQGLQRQQQFLKSIMPTTQKAARTPVQIPTNVALTPEANPYADFQVNPGQKQTVPTSVALPASMARAGVPSSTIAAMPNQSKPTMNFNMLSGQMRPVGGGINQLAVAAEVAGLNELARSLYQQSRPTDVQRNFAAYAAMPDFVQNADGQQVPNPSKVMFERMIKPARRVVPPAETGSVNRNFSAIENLQESLRNNRDVLNVLNVQEQIINGLDESQMGPGTELVGRLQDIATSYFGAGNTISAALGSSAPADVRGAMSSLFTQMTFTQTQKLKGAISNRELTESGKVGPSISDPKAAAIAKIKVQRLLLEKSQRVAAELQKRLRALGGEKYNELIQRDPFLVDNLIIEIGNELDVSSQIQEIIAGAQPTNNNTGAPVPAGTTGSGG